VITLELHGPRETAAVAGVCGELAVAGDWLALDGDLGAGKTLFTAGFARSLGVGAGEVDSPTFVLLNEYRGRFPIFHFDAYRLTATEDELQEIGFFDERLEEGVVLVEWASRVESWLPRNVLRIWIDIISEQDRRLTMDRVSPELVQALARAGFRDIIERSGADDSGD
jgi:tRNA threonylcarbamoyladenosine biosynthesis protein TsaE